MRPGKAADWLFMECPEAMSLLRLSWGSTMQAGPGQPLAPEIREKIQAISHKVQMQILASLSCTMCPDLVAAAQRIASLNPLVTADVYDIAHFPELKEKYNVMSVPCLVINQDKVTFGKKNIQQLLELIGTGNSNEI